MSLPIYKDMTDHQRIIYLHGKITRLESRLETVEGILVEAGLADFLAGEIYSKSDAAQLIKRDP